MCNPINNNICVDFCLLMKKIHYIIIVILLQLLCEIFTYACEIYYYKVCCKNFQTYLFMKSSNMCKKIKNIEINPRKLITDFVA